MLTRTDTVVQRGRENHQGLPSLAASRPVPSQHTPATWTESSPRGNNSSEKPAGRKVVGPSLFPLHAWSGTWERLSLSLPWSMHPLQTLSPWVSSRRATGSLIPGCAQHVSCELCRAYAICSRVLSCFLLLSRNCCALSLMLLAFHVLSRYLLFCGCSGALPLLALHVLLHYLPCMCSPGTCFACALALVARALPHLALMYSPATCSECALPLFALRAPWCCLICM